MNVTFVTPYPLSYGSIRHMGGEPIRALTKSGKYNATLGNCHTKSNAVMFVHLKKPCYNLLHTHKHAKHIFQTIDGFDKYEGFSYAITNNPSQPCMAQRFCVSIPHNFNGLGCGCTATSDMKLPLPTRPILFIPGVRRDSDRSFPLLEQHMQIYFEKEPCPCKMYNRAHVTLAWRRHIDSPYKPLERFTNGLSLGRFTIGDEYYQGLRYLDQQYKDFVCSDEKCILAKIIKFNSSHHYRNEFKSFSARVLSKINNLTHEYDNLFERVLRER